jgi:hypothetical protein
VAGQNGTHDSLTAMRTALRVLVALAYRRRPSEADVEALGRYAPDVADLAPDVLACEVVKRMRHARSRGSGA